MTYKSIKLLALAVICGCSLIGMAIVPIGRGEILLLLMLAVFVVTGIWFIAYWILSEERPK